MNFDSVTGVLLVICVLVPGFILDRTLAISIQQKEMRSKELILLRLLAFSLINYAVSSPIIYFYLPADSLVAFFILHPFFCSFDIIVMPIVLAFAWAKALQKDIISLLAKWLGLQYIAPIPTGWYYKFYKLEPCYLLITLKDGTEIAGYFGKQSFSSSVQEHNDIYLEETYKISNNVWTPVQNSFGLWLSGEQIAFIEFIK